MSIEELEIAAMKLPPEERERLAEKLLSSVDEGLEFEADWAKEADRRVAEVESGAAEPVPGDEVFGQALDRLE